MIERLWSDYWPLFHQVKGASARTFRRPAFQLDLMNCRDSPVRLQSCLPNRIEPWRPGLLHGVGAGLDVNFVHNDHRTILMSLWIPGMIAERGCEHHHLVLADGHLLEAVELWPTAEADVHHTLRCQCDTVFKYLVGLQCNALSCLAGIAQSANRRAGANLRSLMLRQWWIVTHSREPRFFILVVNTWPGMLKQLFIQPQYYWKYRKWAEFICNKVIRTKLFDG